MPHSQITRIAHLQLVSPVDWSQAYFQLYAWFNLGDPHHEDKLLLQKAIVTHMQTYRDVLSRKLGQPRVYDATALPSGDIQLPDDPTPRHPIYFVNPTIWWPYPWRYIEDFNGGVAEVVNATGCTQTMAWAAMCQCHGPEGATRLVHLAQRCFYGVLIGLHPRVGKDSSFRRAFVEHVLAERNVLRLILAFAM